MAWFSSFTRDLVDLSSEEIQPDPATRLFGIDPDRTRDSILRGLMSSRERLAALEAEAQRIQVEASNTRLAISALEAAEKVMTAADPDFAEVDAGKPVIIRRHENVSAGAAS
jgi:hypothetical protein